MNNSQISSPSQPVGGLQRVLNYVFDPLYVVNVGINF